MSPPDLKAPLSGLNAHSAAVDSDLFQLLDEVVEKLHLTVAKPPVYSEPVKRFVRISQDHGITKGKGMAP
jgi:hypothetical protein